MTYNYTEDPNAPESECQHCHRTFDGRGDYCRECIEIIDRDAPDEHESVCRWCGDKFDGHGDCCGGCRADFNAEAGGDECCDEDGDEGEE